MPLSDPQLTKSRRLQLCFRKFLGHPLPEHQTRDSGAVRETLTAPWVRYGSRGRQKIRSSRVRCTSIKSLVSATVQFHSRSFRAQWNVPVPRIRLPVEWRTPPGHRSFCFTEIPAVEAPRDDNLAVIASERRASPDSWSRSLSKNFSD